MCVSKRMQGDRMAVRIVYRRLVYGASESDVSEKILIFITIIVDNGGLDKDGGR